MDSSEDIQKKIFVGSIDFNATEKDVEDAFKPFGEIVHVILLRDKETQKSRGFGFVTFKDRQSVDAAIQGMNKKPILGRPIVVNYAEKKSGGGATVGNQNSSQQNQGGYGYQQQNAYYQGYPGQQGYGGWNQQGYGWGQQAYWPQQPYGGWAQQAQAWSQQQQQMQQSQQQQGSNHNHTGYQQNQGYNGMGYSGNAEGGF